MDGRACSTHEIDEKYIFVGNPERRKPLGRHKRGWEDNIRMDLR